MDISTLLIVAVGAYLIGSISFSRIVTKLMAPDVDLEAVDLEMSPIPTKKYPAQRQHDHSFG